MCTFIVVILNILINADAQGFRRIILLEIDVFPFQGSPEALSDSVIKGSTLTIHELRLGPDVEISMMVEIPFNHGFTLLTGAGFLQIFLSQSNWVVRRPICA